MTMRFCRRELPPDVSFHAPGRFPRLSGIAAALAVLWLLVADAAGLRADTRLVPLVTGLPWSGVSGLIGYDGRLWFVNSVKFVNHNSADIYSFDPQAGTLRYERHLFSQDAGDPVIHGGLLYWPFEDSRWSPGRGEFMVTNGQDWRWGILPEGRAFHVHTMTDHAGALYAAPSAWKARLQRSLDGGTTWRVLYEYPAPPRTVSRIVALAAFEGLLYGGVTAWHDPRSPKLLRWRNERFEPVPGWPAGNSVPKLTPFGGWLYGDNVANEGSAVWRTDGRRVERVAGRSRRAGRAIYRGRRRGNLGRNGGCGRRRSLAQRGRTGLETRAAVSWPAPARCPGVRRSGLRWYQGSDGWHVARSGDARASRRQGSAIGTAPGARVAE
jgi:hypothetical protein